MQSVELVEKAKQAYARKKYLDAANLFGQAASAYETANDVLMSAEMRNNQSVSFLQAGKAQASLTAVLGTDDIFAAAGDIKRQGMAVANKAAALGDLKKLDEALACYEAAAKLLEQAGEPDLRADVMRSIATLLARQGKFTDAVMSMQSGLIEIKKPSLWQRFMKKLLFLRLWR